MDILSQLSLALFGILPGNYSGITHVSGTQYAVVDDKDRTDGFKFLEIDIDPASGKIRHASMAEPAGMARRRKAGEGKYRDCEGVAYFAPGNTVLVSGEEDQRIAEYSLDGIPTGKELDVPERMKRERIERNLGFEALTYNAATGLFWTTTESTLPADGKRSSLSAGTVANRLRLLSFGSDFQPREECFYLMDKPSAGKRRRGAYAHGVPAMAALDDGRLIVMEREIFVASGKLGSFCTIKLFLVNPAQESAGSGVPGRDMPEKGGFIEKTLLTQFSTHLRLGKMNFANYEGMCLGPRLADGRQTLLLIADSQGGAGNRLYRLKDYLRVIILDL